MITRRRFTQSFFGAAGALAAGCGNEPVAPPPEEKPRPHIVLLMGDDHGWEETGYNGHPYVKTPVLDEMAASGIRLDRFYTASPVCSPTRGSVLTGRHPNRYGTFTPNWSIRPEEVTVAQILSGEGYATGHFGKWHLGPVKADSPTNPGAMGFDEWLSHDNFFELDPTLSRNGAEPEKFEGESSQIVVDEAMRFMEKEAAAGKPTFTVVWFGSPHEPYAGLPEDLALYDDLPEKYADETTRLTSLETGLPTERPLRDVLRDRYAEITAMDRAIGSMRERLGELGLRDDTILWYCGDNGTPGGVNVASPLRGAKGDVYDGGTRVPGLIEWPGQITVPRASSVNSVTSDILPTLCAIVEAPMPERPLDGVSLAPLLAGEMERAEPIEFWSYDAGHETKTKREPYIDPALQVGTTPLAKQMNGAYTRTFRNLKHPEIEDADFGGRKSIIDGRYKLVVADGARELYDLQDDEAETRNVIEEHAEIATELEERLVAWQRSVLESLTGADY